MRFWPDPVDSRALESDFAISILRFSVLGVDDPVPVRTGDDTLVGDETFSSLVTASLMDLFPVNLAFADAKMFLLKPEGLGAALSLDTSLALSSICVGLAAIVFNEGLLVLGSSLVTIGLVWLSPDLLRPGVVAER